MRRFCLPGKNGFAVKPRIWEALVLRKIHVQHVSIVSIVLAVIVSAACIACFVFGYMQFEKLKTITQSYSLCRNTAQELEDGSAYLTDKVRLAAMSGDVRYVDQYFTEVNTYHRRDGAVKTLRESDASQESIAALEAALQTSQELMDTEYYAMKLVEEAANVSIDEQPRDIRTVKLKAKDAKLSAHDKLDRARELVCSEDYEDSRSMIDAHLQKCVDAIVQTGQDSQNHAVTVFEDIYRKLEICLALLAVMSVLVGLILRHLVVTPLIHYNKSIAQGEIFPVIGAWELQNLAETYNRVYRENETTQMLIKHQAEHDPLTDLLNRGSFDKVLDLYDDGKNHFALILCDVDKFKTVNDTYGHAVGDKILKRVSGLLKTAFRSVDHVCRIGGDEFAVVMVEMTSDLAYTIAEKIDYVNEQLAALDDEGMPQVSVSAGAAFADRKDPGTSIFTDADAALYHTKENGRCGISFYGEF